MDTSSSITGRSTTCFTKENPSIAYCVAGSGAPVLFIHGIGGNRSNWDEQISEFSRQYRAISVDLRGYGESGDFEGPLTFDALASDIVAVLDAENIDRAHIVGLSLGGMVAQWLWYRHASRVLSLTLADTTVGPAASLSDEEISSFLESRRAPLLAGTPMAEIAARNSPALFSDGADAALIAAAQTAFASVPPSTYLRALECATRFAGIPGFDDIAIPVMVLVGEDDHSLPVPLSRELAQKIPGAEFHIIPASGHLSNMETPGAFNALLHQFLAGQS